MDKTSKSPAFIKTFLFLVAVLFVALMITGLSREMGWVSPDLGKRIAGAMISAMLVVLGNYAPKVVRPLETDPQLHSALSAGDRLAGIMLVLGGTGAILTWIFAPIDRAPFGASMIALAGVFLALAGWLIQTQSARKSAGIDNALLWKMSVGHGMRLSMMLILLGIFGGMVLFQADAIWGDRVAQPLAIGISMVFSIVGSILVLSIRKHHQD